jgi:hypothetical protein
MYFNRQIQKWGFTHDVKPHFWVCEGLDEERQPRPGSNS